MRIAQENPTAIAVRFCIQLLDATFFFMVPEAIYCKHFFEDFL